MQKINIQDKSFKFPTTYSECKVWLAKVALGIYEKQNKEFKTNITDKPEDIKQGDWLNFLIDWVCAVTGASEDLIKKVSITDLNTIWGMTQYILSMPENVLMQDKLNGVKITESVTTLSGAKLIGGEATYEQWALLNKLNVMIKEADMIKQIDLLKQMLTIVYPVADETKDQTKKRLEDFEYISLLQLYSGWFFFAKLLSGWGEVIQLLEQKDMKPKEWAKMQTKLARIQLLHAIGNSIFGRFTRKVCQKQMRWLLDLTL